MISHDIQGYEREGTGGGAEVRRSTVPAATFATLGVGLSHI